MKGEVDDNFPDTIDEVGRLRDVRAFRAISIWLGPDLYLDLKRRSVAERRSVNEIITNALAAYDLRKRRSA
jgi:hypothetical protein